MSVISSAVGLILLLLPMAAEADSVTYAFSGTGTDGGGETFPQSFTYFAFDTVTSRVDLVASQLAFDVNSQFVVFQPDAGPNTEYNHRSDAIVSQIGGNAFGYFFPVGTFAKLGTFDAVVTSVSTGTVTISAGGPPGTPVPEPNFAAILGVVAIMLVARPRHAAHSEIS